jgi:hypothetical protein
MSPEELLEPSRTCRTPERGVDLGFGHDERQRTIERLGFGRRVEDLSRFVELYLIDA